MLQDAVASIELRLPNELRLLNRENQHGALLHHQAPRHVEPREAEETLPS
jgi:hypothetical protein